MTDEPMKVHEKRESSPGREQTTPGKTYSPDTDIYETEEALVVVMDLPGVDRGRLSVSLERDQLRVEGGIDFSAYEGLSPVYTEYNVGHFSRTFALSSKIDRDGITARIAGGVLTLTLPKSPEQQPRRIRVT